MPEAQLIEGIELPRLGTGANPRSEGLHISSVIKDLMAKSGLKTPKSSWNMPTTQSVGFIWEEALFLSWEDRLSRAFASLLGKEMGWYGTGELLLDGIYMTPDGLDPNNEILQEAKCTWKSVKNQPMDNFSWMCQTKGYCKVLRINRVMFHVLYLVGDYKNSGPIYQPWLITFKPHEIEENWQMILNHKEFMTQ
jgi:hypothetical protein